MKTRLLIIGILSFLTINIYAQQKRNWEEVRAQRIAFITQEVGITPAEAEKLWPLYHEYQEKKFKIGREKAADERRFRNGETVDYNKALDKILELELKEAQLSKEYFGKFREIISAEKLFKLFSAEREFKRQTIRQRQQKQ